MIKYIWFINIDIIGSEYNSLNLVWLKFKYISYFILETTENNSWDDWSTAEASERQQERFLLEETDA